MAPQLTQYGRHLFGICLLLSWLNSSANILACGHMPYTRGIDMSLRLPFKAEVFLIAVMTAAGLAAGEAFVLRFYQAWTGASVLVLIAAMRAIEMRQWPGETVVSLGKYFPAAACLAAYLAAFGLAAKAPLSYREAAGWEAACGVLAAAYALSAWTKWRKAGKAWFNSTNLGLLMAERKDDKPLFLGPLRLYLACSPRFCKAFAALALILEACGVVYVVPSARWPFTIAATLFQAGIAVLLGYMELEWILLIIALTINSLGRAAPV